jgi:thiol-disulfide isomerase/thioredoxin
VVGAAFLYIIAAQLIKPDTQQGQFTAGKGPAGESLFNGVARAEDAAVPMHLIPTLTAKGVGQMAPETKFLDGEGKSVSLADFRGKVVLLNLWATWCTPCRLEMPQLAALQKAYQGKDVVVLALSIDSRKSGDKAKAFIGQNAPLAFYHDPEFALPPAINPPVAGFPTSLYVDKTGRIRGQVNGEADWTGPKARAALDQLLAE